MPRKKKHKMKSRGVDNNLLDFLEEKMKNSINFYFLFNVSYSKYC